MVSFKLGNNSKVSRETEYSRGNPQTAFFVDWPWQNVRSLPLTRAAFSSALTSIDINKLRALPTYPLCFPSFCFPSLSTAIPCEKWELNMTLIIENQRLESGERQPSKRWCQNLMAFAVFFWCCRKECEWMQERKSTQTSLSLLRKWNADRRV